MADASVGDCPICLDALEPGDAVGVPHDNALACQGGHWVCVPCLRKILQPDPSPRSDGRSGHMYQCPLCRKHCVLSVLNAHVLIKGSWSEAVKTLPCACHLHQWMEGTAQDHSEDDADGDSRPANDNDSDEEEEDIVQLAPVRRVSRRLLGMAPN